MIGVVATIKILPGMEESFERVVKDLADKVLENEEDCLLYTVSRSRSQKGVYVTMEQYVDEAALQRHMAARYIVDTKPLHTEFFAEQPSVEYLVTLC